MQSHLLLMSTDGFFHTKAALRKTVMCVSSHSHAYDSAAFFIKLYVPRMVLYWPIEAESTAQHRHTIQVEATSKYATQHVLRLDISVQNQHAVPTTQRSLCGLNPCRSCQADAIKHLQPDCRLSHMKTHATCSVNH
jgi:hypothetical protein